MCEEHPTAGAGEVFSGDISQEKPRSSALLKTSPWLMGTKSLPGPTTGRGQQRHLELTGGVIPIVRWHGAMGHERVGVHGKHRTAEDGSNLPCLTPLSDPTLATRATLVPFACGLANPTSDNAMHLPNQTNRHTLIQRKGRAPPITWYCQVTTYDPLCDQVRGTAPSLWAGSPRPLPADRVPHDDDAYMTP